MFPPYIYLSIVVLYFSVFIYRAGHHRLSSSIRHSSKIKTSLIDRVGLSRTNKSALSAVPPWLAPVRSLFTCYYTRAVGNGCESRQKLLSPVGCSPCPRESIPLSAPPPNLHQPSALFAHCEPVLFSLIGFQICIYFSTLAKVCQGLLS